MIDVSESVLEYMSADLLLEGITLTVVASVGTPHPYPLIIDLMPIAQ